MPASWALAFNRPLRLPERRPELDANAAFVWVLGDGSSNANRRSVVNLRQIGVPAWFQSAIAPFAWRDLFFPDRILSGGLGISQQVSCQRAKPRAALWRSPDVGLGTFTPGNLEMVLFSRFGLQSI